jgi:Short C-terminal domain
MIGRRGVGRAGRPSLVGTAARTAVIAGTATAVAGKVSGAQQAKAQQAAQANAVQQQAAVDAPAPAPPPPAPAPPASAEDVPLAQLEKLAKLYQQGILNAEEFAAKAVTILVP